jgi:hypothetical protein
MSNALSRNGGDGPPSDGITDSWYLAYGGEPPDFEAAYAMAILADHPQYARLHFADLAMVSSRTNPARTIWVRRPSPWEVAPEFAAALDCRLIVARLPFGQLMKLIVPTCGEVGDTELAAQAAWQKAMTTHVGNLAVFGISIVDAGRQAGREDELAEIFSSNLP